MKNTIIKLKKSQLYKIINESIEKVISTDDDFNLSKYLDTIPVEELKTQYEDYSYFVELNGYNSIRQIDESESNKISNATNAANEIKEKFNLKNWQVLVRSTHNHVEIIIIYANIFKNTRRIISEMNSLGFFDSKSWTVFKKMMLWKAIKFEPQIQNDLTDKAKQYGVLYHLTLESNAENINAQGLIPSHKNSFFKFPNRVYVLCGNISEANIIYFGQQLRNKDKNNKYNDGKYILYQINTDKLPDSIHFYGDPNCPYGYFTNNQIPSTCLNIIKHYTFN